MYREVALNCFRYFGFKTFAEVDRVTFAEYRLLMEAARLRQIDMDYRNHLQAWLTFSAQATDRKGKPIYKRFKKFYDYEKHLDSARGENREKKSKLSGLYKFLKSRE